MNFSNHRGRRTSWRSTFIQLIDVLLVILIFWPRPPRSRISSQLKVTPPHWPPP